MFSFLTKPNYPNAAVGIEKAAVTVLSLQKDSGRFLSVRSAASVQLPTSLVNPDFFESNVSSRNGLGRCLVEAASLAGLLNQRNWSVALPANSARSAILTIEGGKNEADEVLDWKAEQSFGAPALQLRITKHRIANDAEGRTRYFATAIKLTVIDEYESVLEELGWKAGLILPRPVCEANWLIRDRITTDTLLISSQEDGFTAFLFGSGEPNVVRSVTCSSSEKEDEIYRLLLFYNDRFAKERGSNQLDRVLAIGKDLSAARLNEIAVEALGRTISFLLPSDLGFGIPDASIGFDEIAAPAGVAALGCT